MTREKAISRLIDLKTCLTAIDTALYGEAIDMAIEALSEPITTGQHCGECGKPDLSTWETTSTEE